MGKNKQSSETAVVRRIGFTEDNKKPKRIKIPSAEPQMSSHHESTPGERIFKDATYTVVTLILIFTPVVLAINVSAWWLFLWVWELFYAYVRMLRS